jgi:hypothetical protein
MADAARTHNRAGLGWARSLSGLLCLLSLLWGACKKGEPTPPPPRVTRISVAGLPESMDPEHDPRLSQLIEAAQKGLRQAGVTVQPQPAAAQASDFQLRLRLEVQRGPLPDGKPGQRVRLLCAGALSLMGGTGRLLAEGDERKPTPPLPEISKFDHVGMTEKELPGEPAAGEGGNEQVLALLVRLVEDSAGTLGQELQLLRADSRELMAQVAKSDGDPALRGTAIQILGRRKERLSIPVLVALIKETGARRKTSLRPSAETAEKDPKELRRQRQQDEILSVLRDTAIGALIEIGDRSAVRPLLESVAFVDTVEMGKIVEAAAALGGEDARNYLRFVSQSHPEAAVRDEAAAALKRLEKKEGEPTPAAAP